MVSAPGTVGDSAHPIREFPVNGYVGVVLCGESEIREEWGAMRNCALEYVGRCREGGYRLVSLRDRETGERVVTVVLKRERRRYVALDARRRFNRPADPPLWAAAQRAAVIYSSAGGVVPTRRVERCRRMQPPKIACSAGMLVGSQGTFDFGEA